VTHLTSELIEFVRAWLPSAPARVLEVGCGDGALTRALAGDGFEVVAIDPEPPEGPPFVRSTIEDFESDAPFDAAVAIRSLHHVGDLGQAVASLAAALCPGARLIMSEFAMENYDEQARSWMESVGLEETMDRHFDGVLALAAVRAALETRFTEATAEPVPYLAREARREDVHEQEREAITRAELKPLGMRLVYELR
jgi:2-polyprenyl-3-methyl-5-hydroxy-6-metoxy-1,4-benzoquinol methylase